MTYQQPPAPAPQNGWPQPPAPQAPRRVPVWPFILGGAVLLLIVLGVIAAIAIPAYLRAQEEAQLAADEKAAEETVLAFDAAYEDADCDDFEAVTDEDFRDEWSDRNFDEDYDCDAWEDAAEELSEDGDYLYSVDVDEVEVRGDRATVTTTESFDDGEQYEYEYKLERQDDGVWLVTAYDEA